MGGASSSSSGLAVGGIRAGAGAARAGFLGSRAVANALSRILGGPNSILGALFAAKSGQTIVLAGMAIWAALIGAAGLSLLSQSRNPGGAQGALALSMDQSGIVIDRPGDASLGMLSKANEGELAWDENKGDAQDAAAQDKKVGEDEGKKDEGAVPEGQGPDVSQMLAQAGKNRLGGGNFGALSKNFQGGGGFGGMGAGKGLKNGTAGFNLKGSLSGLPRKTPTGKMAAFARTSKLSAVGKMRSLRGRANRAMGQLKMSRTLSNMGATSTPDAQSKQYAANAFDQQASQGGQNPTIDSGGPSPTPVVPPGTGAPEVPELPVIPPIDPGINYTPYQNMLNSARGLGDSSAGLKTISVILIIVGIALIAIGSAIPMFGAILIAIGAAILAIGVMLLAMSMMMAAMAKAIGKGIDKLYGQLEQQQIVDTCANQATQGIKTANCQTPKTNMPVNNVKQSVENESKADYKLPQQ